MLANDKFKFEEIKDKGFVKIVLKGNIDEDTELDTIAKNPGPLVFNFKNVTSINSLGVRTWVNLMKLLAGKSVTFEECPPVIVRQMNMIPSFKGTAKVQSVLVPYVCDECEAEAVSLVTQENFSQVAEAYSCENCKKGELEFDGNPKQYFAFTK
jgi:anti-anti-sigma regulatory factor